MEEEISIIIKQTGTDESTAIQEYNIDNNTVNSIIRILKKNTLSNDISQNKKDISQNSKDNEYENLSDMDNSDIESIHQKKIKELREILNEKDKLLNAYKKKN